MIACRFIFNCENVQQVRVALLEQVKPALASQKEVNFHNELICREATVFIFGPSVDSRNYAQRNVAIPMDKSGLAGACSG